MKKKCYRIILDEHAGYEVQIWRIWFPFWVQKHHVGHINTFSTIVHAKAWIEKGCPKESTKIVVYKTCK